MLVTTTYDSQNNTWNIMGGSECIQYFDNIVIENCELDAIDLWLQENPEYKLEAE